MSPVYRLIPRRTSAPVRAIQRQRNVTPTPEPETETETADYGSLLKADLVETADKRDIDSSGTKADIVERLEADDAD